MDILRIATAGSVDDGKSTLIGRLLYETNAITKDKIEALEAASKRKGLDFLDLSLLTDGLIAEREQGITIDVAHIYFSTPRRKYIIGDTPGHFEYTRNMVTGASNAKVSLILIDARHGVVEQTFRHFFIAAMLRIPQVIVCVNKMDLVGYSQTRFEDIRADFERYAKQVAFPEQTIRFIPISSLFGENISTKSTKIDWYSGASLLETLENITPEELRPAIQPGRFPVQLVVRPKTESHHDFRGYAGRIASGSFQVGQEIEVLPSERKSRIASIEKFETSLETAQTGESVVITLTDDVDVSRGNMIVGTDKAPQARKDFSAQLCWLSTDALQNGKTLLLQHNVHQTKAKIVSIEEVIDVQTLQKSEATSLVLNQIGSVSIRTAQPIFADSYASNPTNGAFILIDEYSNATVGVGFIQA